jgi:hypothetical protein
MEKRYSVFVSSTYRDLNKQRKGINEFLLKSNYIPLMMENFGSSSKPSLKVIKEMLKITDYYVLIISGVYGSIVPSKRISYTENEYDIALEYGIPVLPFIYEGILDDSMVEKSEENQKKLLMFKEKVKKNHNVSLFQAFEDLPALILSSLTNECKSTPREGWIRGIEYKRNKYREYVIGLNFKAKELSEEQIANIKSRMYEFYHLLFPVDLNTPVRPVQEIRNSFYYTIRFIVEAKNPQIAEVRRNQFEIIAKEFGSYANSYLRDFEGFESKD